MGIIAFLVIGVLAGLIARALMPGRQSMGLVATMILGCVGSFVGGLIGSLFHSGGDRWALSPSNLLWSVIGSIVVLLLVGLASGRRRAVV